ncbi:MAG: hypothetical protein A2252_04055 [Elusimicrobia bacterium RIFOXYA2_FULL_39_19]|nr:MAG: hypothetical protein A2252_04055 [Elusimicrobia bacterium RIFOXYA2_FULL_39_19]
MKKIIIITLVLILAVSGYLFFKGKKKTATEQEINPKIGTISIDFRLNGSVEPRNRLEIKPQVSGRIEDVLVVEGQKIKKGEIIAWMSSTDRATLIDLARSKGDAEVKKWEDTYKPTPIISPITGFIILRNKEPGQTVTTADVLLVMADELIVKAQVDETDLRNIYLDQKAMITLDAYPGKSFPGKIEHIAYESTVVSNVTVYEVKINPARAPQYFRAGMSSTIEIVSQKKDDVLILPADAVVEKGRRKFVKVKTKKPGGELKQVETGINNGKFVEIVSGVTEEDTVLISNGDSISSRGTSRSGGIPGMPGRPH